MQLLDTVTGRALYAVEHPEAKGPVRAVFCENWVVYQYWSTRTGRTQVSVLELYDDVATRREQRGVQGQGLLGEMVDGRPSGHRGLWFERVYPSKRADVL